MTRADSVDDVSAITSEATDTSPRPEDGRQPTDEEVAAFLDSLTEEADDA